MRRWRHGRPADGCRLMADGPRAAVTSSIVNNARKKEEEKKKQNGGQCVYRTFLHVWNTENDGLKTVLVFFSTLSWSLYFFYWFAYIGIHWHKLACVCMLIVLIWSLSIVSGNDGVGLGWFDWRPLVNVIWKWNMIPLLHSRELICINSFQPQAPMMSVIQGHDDPPAWQLMSCDVTRGKATRRICK